MNATLLEALYRNRPARRHHHRAVPVLPPERAEWAKAGLPVLYEHCVICGCVPDRFMGVG